MSSWILVCAVVLAAYLIARAIESLSQTLKPSASLSSLKHALTPKDTNQQPGASHSPDTDLGASMDERFIVSQMAATLIAAQFGSPLYTEGIKSLHDNRETICYDRIEKTLGEIAATPDAKAQLEAEHKNLDEMLSNVDSAIYQSSVFSGGRAKFVQLAWDIYHDVCLTQREHTGIE